VEWENSTYNIPVSHYNDSVGWEPTVLLARGNCTGADVLAERNGGAIVIFSADISGWDLFACRFPGSGVPPVDPTKPASIIHASPHNYWKVWSFDGRGSTDDVKIVKYMWDFGDGSLGRARFMSHLYRAPGEYTVSLTVWDGDGNSNTSSVKILVAPPS
jgi:hypothetical protein